MIRCPDNQINASFIDISRIKWLVFLLWSSFFRTTNTVASSEAPADYQPAPGRTDGVPERHSKTMDYKSVFTNLCLELQQNRSWIKGLCKNPQKSELIHWRQCLLSGGHRSVFPRTPRNTGVYTRHPTFVTASRPRRVACWHARTASGKTLKKRNACTHAVRSDTGGREKKLCVPYGLQSEGVNQDHFHFSLTPLSDSRTNCYSFLSKILGILKSDASDISR